MAGPRRQMFTQNQGSVGASGWIRAGLAVGAFVPTVLVLGWSGRDPILTPWFGHALQTLLLALYIASYFVISFFQPSVSNTGLRSLILRNRAPLGIAAASLLLFWAPGVMHAGAAALVLFHLMRIYIGLSHSGLPPGAMFVGSFVLLVAAGSGGLLLPAATPVDRPVTVLDAVFTATSAISQTGLLVRDTGADFTRFGHIVILVLIQVGALGVLVFGALLASVLGGGFGLRATQTMAEPTEQGWTGALSLKRLVLFIVILTFALELAGIVAFYVSWPDEFLGSPDMSTTGDRLFHSVFFSISSFCNAGFSTAPNSLEGLRASSVSHLIVVPLVLIGSIGFPVLDNLWRVAWARLKGKRVHRGSLIRLNLNTKIVLSATLGVYILGYVLIVIGEYTQTTEPTRLILLDAHFMTINRTSGFNTIAPADMGMLSQLTLILLMFIGGSPGSVAGGIKMMVFAVLVYTVIATIVGRNETEAFGRTIPDALVRKSATLIVLMLLSVMAVTGILAATETGQGQFTLGQLLFEATSACGTTGYSMGVTPETGTTGRIALTVAMFVGRVGPLAVMASLVAIGRRRKVRYSYPTEDVVIY